MILPHYGLAALAAEPGLVKAPTKDLEMRVWLEGGVPYYAVFLGGQAVIENSRMGFRSGAGDFSSGLTLISETRTSGDETWKPLVGEVAEIDDRYNGADFRLRNVAGAEITIETRVYDTGAAFRYILPVTAGNYQVTEETTQFAFAAGGVAQVLVGATQVEPTTIPVGNFSTSARYHRPLTVEYPSGAVVTIAEANLRNYPIITMRGDASAPRALNIRYGGDGAPAVISGGNPASTPWRVIVVAEELRKLPLNSTIIPNLNPPPNEGLYKFSEWVKPGKNLMLGAGAETTNTMRNWVNSARDNGLEYVLLDYGWYGPELDDRCDPRLDPTKLEPEAGDSEELAAAKLLLKNYIYEDSRFDASGDRWFPPYGLLTREPVWSADGRMSPNMNIREVCAYANSQGIGMILYVNGRHMFDRFGRYTPDELFARFAEWGVAGVKPGFVTCWDQASEKRNLEMIEAAARHKLVLTIHDEYITTGIERTFPNCLTVEGISGDEEVKTQHIAQDINKLFTRSIQGPTDHTFCYPGKATRGYALASSMMFRTGLNSLYWYGSPNSLAGLRPAEKKFWADLPANWDDFAIPEAKVSSYATFARKNANDWYFGSISAIERVMFVPLNFLDPGKEYVAEIYQDALGINAWQNPHAPIICVSYIVDSNTAFTRPMDYGTGFAARIRPKTEADTGLLRYYGEYERLKNLVGMCEILDKSMYTVTTWSALETAFNVAASLLDSPTPAPQQLNDAFEALLVAKAALRSVVVVINELNKVKCLTAAHFTPESWALLAAAREFADGKLQSPTVTQAELDESAERIKAAASTLVKRWLEPDTTTYLSDLQWLPESYASWGAIRRDRSYENPGIQLIVDGESKSFSKGLGAHARSDIYFNIENSGYEIFEAYVGINWLKSQDRLGNVIFRVYSDEVLVYESIRTSSYGYEAQRISIPIANTKVLRLEVDPDGADSHDHADWADAKFIKMREITPDSTISGISVNGVPLLEFTGGRLEYTYPVAAGDPVPEVTVSAPTGVSFDVIPAMKTPGVTVIEVTRPGGSVMTYTVSFKTAQYTYLSDLDWDSLDNHGSGYGIARKDRPYEFPNDPLLVTGPDGTNPLALPPVNGVLKGIGMHADCSITYNIAGKGYGRFEAWVGASHTKDYPTNSMIFHVFINGSETPIYSSPAMSYLKPAVFVSIDLEGVNTIRLMLDKNGVDAGDHGNWANARFLKYDEIPEENLMAALDTIYLSDLDWDSVDTHGSGAGGVLKDAAYEGNRMLVTSADGINPLLLAPVGGRLKGLGMHADCSVTYDIQGKGYGRFQAWVGASHQKNHPTNSMVFKVFLDGSPIPAYESPAMSYLKPAEFVDVDLAGAKTITLFLDKNGEDFGDHGNWADAKFVPKPRKIASTTYLSDINWDNLDTLGSPYGGAFKDRPFEGNWVLVTAPDGINALDLPQVGGVPKGIGMHADCMLTYNIADQGYDRFEAWVGASHLKNYNNRMIFRVYLNDSKLPVYTSPQMRYLQPAEFISINLEGVYRIRLELDRDGVDSGDHGSWADAKFITYAKEGVSFMVDGEPTAGIVPGKRLSISANLAAGGDYKGATVYAALYDQRGVLRGMDAVSGDLDVDMYVFDLAIDVPANIGSGAYAKVFTWDEGFIPIREPVTIP